MWVYNHEGDTIMDRDLKEIFELAMRISNKLLEYNQEVVVLTKQEYDQLKEDQESLYALEAAEQSYSAAMEGDDDGL
jgi:hypothetical protein